MCRTQCINLFQLFLKQKRGQACANVTVKLAPKKSEIIFRYFSIIFLDTRKVCLNRLSSYVNQTLSHHPVFLGNLLHDLFRGFGSLFFNKDIAAKRSDFKLSNLCCRIIAIPLINKFRRFRRFDISFFSNNILVRSSAAILIKFVGSCCVAVAWIQKRSKEN